MANAKKSKIPHSLVIIVSIMLLACFLTYLIPAGAYDRVKNDAGQTMVDPTTFHYVDNTPVNPFTVLNYIFPGLTKAASIIFCLMCAGGGLGIVLSLIHI